MGFVTKEKLFSKDFFITYGWLLGGCFMFALGALWFCSRGNIRSVHGLSSLVGLGN